MAQVVCALCTCRIEWTEVVAIQPRIGMTSGGRALYNLEARRANGKTATVAWHLRTRRDAEMLAQRLMRSLGVRYDGA